ncbi:MarR family winged helix-turn-helix transcriptional regulator [Paenibacillus sp. BC26]|uniref:MarR family winged helix-turn-helix transcriptional regulator n=1 Tax=Paenibacillus sp. BC26 TaxID=1881032 RepID=UPI0008E926DC|nr:MarR family transcriptional regulator [Paenibacillus sp. BC26]SFT04548.1 DNA-binding transcriptional regulator, MarR family [Paenibacillus sp. BC26]
MMTNIELCNCTKLRRAARHITRFYDTCLSETGSGLRATQYAILGYLKNRGSQTMNELAELMTMDRATIGHNLRPLERDGLVRIEVSERDRRARIVSITDEGLNRMEIGRIGWERAQAEFEGKFGAEHAASMRNMMDDVVGVSLQA